MDVYAIVRLKKPYDIIEAISQDEQRLTESGYSGVKIQIPLVRLLAKTLIDGPQYYYKPLLFNYGFVKLPIYLTYNYETLQFISLISTSISSFVFRSRETLKEELFSLKADMAEESSNINSFKVNQCMVETVSSYEVVRLEMISKNLSVYPVTDELKIGAHIILKGYPFAGLAARVEAKQGHHLKVTLLSTESVVSITTENVFYSPYEESSIKEICFSDLGYVPEISTEDY